MTREEELERYIEDRDQLESQIEADNEIMKQIEMQYPDTYQQVDEWNYAWDEVTAASNEVQSLTNLIDEIEETLSLAG